MQRSPALLSLSTHLLQVQRLQARRDREAAEQVEQEEIEQAQRLSLQEPRRPPVPPSGPGSASTSAPVWPAGPSSVGPANANLGDWPFLAGRPDVRVSSTPLVRRGRFDPLEDPEDSD